MSIEYEATFLNVDKNDIRKRLKKTKARLLKPEFLQKRVVFNLPNKSGGYSWLKVRNEGDKITMSFKKHDGNKIKDQEEVDLIINDFKKGIEFLTRRVSK